MEKKSSVQNENKGKKDSYLNNVSLTTSGIFPQNNVLIHMLKSVAVWQ